MKNQKHLFNIEEEVIYLNCATKSPALNSCAEAGIEAIGSYGRPYERTADDFFSHNEQLKKTFAKLVDAGDHERMAVIPSVSYAIANAVNNIDFSSGDNIVIPDGQFPSNVYSWMEIAKEKELDLRIIAPPDTQENRGEKWNEAILEAIDARTKVVAIAHVMWSDGTKFDLKKIRTRLDEHHGYLIVDGTQSVGALPFSIQDIKPDALICAGYKWLLGPYAIGLAYYNDRFDDGVPIENNWMTRKNSHDFAGLVNYQSAYRPKAYRYSSGESSQFILRPMLQKSLEQLLDWGVQNIQDYTRQITHNAMEEIRDLGVYIEKDDARSHHLFGLFLPKNMQKDIFKKELEKRKIFVSFRGDAIRVSPHVYNTEEDMMALYESIKRSIK